MESPERYQGKPILIVIENYALATIGQLAPEKLAGIAAIVQRVWGGGGDWMQTVREQLAWDESMDGTIRSNWQAYQHAAREQGVQGSAVEFAMMFADALEKESRSDLA